MSDDKNTAARRARKARKAAERRLIRDFRPPEGVVLTFQVAGLGARIGAQMLDLAITFFGVLAIVILLLVTEIAPWSVVSTIAALAFFFIRAPYYVMAELLWNGQTLGKRMTGLRVVSADGRSLRPYSVTVRNLMKEMEVFVPGTMLVAVEYISTFEVLVLVVWICVLLAVPLMNRKRQRLGDMIAGTYVIYQPKAVLMPDMAQAGQHAERFSFLNHQLEHYGRFELQTLERILQLDTSRHTSKLHERHAENVASVVEKIRTKIEFTDQIAPSDHREFLQAFYVAQRRFLETRRLFGDAREDKFHREDSTEPVD